MSGRGHVCHANMGMCRVRKWEVPLGRERERERERDENQETRFKINSLPVLGTEFTLNSYNTMRCFVE